MNLFGWRIFEDRPRTASAPAPTPAPTPASAPAPAPSNPNNYYSFHNEWRNSRPAPGVSLAPTVGREKTNNEGLSLWQKILNYASGTPGGIYNKPGVSTGPVHYYTGAGQPYDPRDYRDIVDRKNQGQPMELPSLTGAPALQLPTGAPAFPAPAPLQTWTAPAPTPTPSPSIAMASAPRLWGGYGAPPGNPAPAPSAPALQMPDLAPAPGLPDWSTYTEAPIVPGTGQGPLQAVAPIAPAQAMAPAPPAAPITRFDPALASQAMQRYLTAAGWGGAPAPVRSTGNELIDAATARYLGAHGYQVPRWQQEQIAADYGVGPLGDERTLYSNTVRTAQANAADYGRLTPQQQNAMRFNQLLIAAAEADRRAQVAPEEQDKDYRTKVEALFGEHGGSQVYAPNTINLLQRMNMGSLKGQDLDEYLSLDRAYDVNEIKNLKPWEATPEIAPYVSAGVSAGPEVQLALDQRQADMAGSLIAKALGDTSARGWNEQARIDAFLGTRPPVEQIPFGWLKQGEARATDEDNAKEELFQGMYDYLSSNAATNLDEFWNATKSRNFTDEDYNEIFDYFYQRSLDDDRLGPPDANHRTGAETRKFIGIG